MPQSLRQQQLAIVAVTALVFGVCTVLLDIDAVYILQKNREMLDPMRRSLGGWGAIFLVSAALLGGGAVGGVLGAGHVLFRDFLARHRWLRLVSIPALTLMIALLFALHWLNNVVFDAVHAYVIFNGIDFLAGNATLIYQRMLLSSHGQRGISWLLLDFYYPNGHVLVAALLATFYLARTTLWKLFAQPRVARGAAKVAAATFAAALLSSVLLSWKAPLHQRQSFCGSLSLTASLLPQCHAVLPPLPQGQAPQTTRHSKPAVKAVGADTTRRKRHVVLVILESVAPSHLSLYGYERATSPQMAALGNCDRFDYAFATSNITHRGLAAIFGGRAYPLGVPDGIHAHSPLPKMLRKAGYQTAFFGAAVGFRETRKTLHVADWDRFFDTFVAASHRLRPQQPCTDDCHMLRELELWLRTQRPLRDNGRGQFIVFAPYASHFVYGTPAVWKPRFIKRVLKLYSPLFYPRSEQQTVIDYYDNSLAFVDYLVGRLVVLLRREGLLANTMLLITSDHGEDLYRHGEPSHGTNLFDSQVRVPLLVCLPGRVGRQRAENVSHLDIAPTILRAARLSVPADLEGSDLRSTIAADRPLLLTNDLLVRAHGVVMGAHKYIRDRTRRREALFDFKGDPAEKHNLVAERPALLQRMRRLLQQALSRARARAK